MTESWDKFVGKTVLWNLIWRQSSETCETTATQLSLSSIWGC